MRTRIIEPTPPFNFELSSHIFADGDAQIARYDGKAYRQVLRIKKKLILVSVTSNGSVDRPHLKVAFDSDHNLTDRDINEATAVVRSIYNVSLDITPFYRAISDDRILADVAEQLRGLKNPVTQTVFEALFDSIVEQQIALNVAHILQRRVIKKMGDVLRVGSDRYYAFPTPENLAQASVDSLRHCGLSRRKAEYIKDAARRVVAR